VATGEFFFGIGLAIELELASEFSAVKFGVLRRNWRWQRRRRSVFLIFFVFDWDWRTRMGARGRRKAEKL